MLNCVCCGTEITAPQFYKGEPYGWSCVLKQDPNYKRSKSKAVWLPCTIKFEIDGGVRCTSPKFKKPLKPSRVLYGFIQFQGLDSCSRHDLFSNGTSVTGFVKVVNEQGKQMYKSISKEEALAWN